MTLTIVAGLLGLSLLDSTSFGTLLIPLWLLLTPGRVRVGNVARYLVTIGAFYFVAGVAIAAGATTALDTLQGTFDGLPEQPMRVAQLVIGLGVVALSYWLEARAKRTQGQPGRLAQWRDRAMTETGSGGGMTRLAVIAATLEVLTMLPYLVAIGILASADLGAPRFALGLAGYCVVMCLPAVALTILRVVGHERVEPTLRRISDFFARNSAKAVGWTVGAIGIGVTLNAIVNLVVLNS
ncbi:GAP family protein [Spiractinospora alimapuensis]|uniref:GAP family protein n=1 Tax=Spiractinospora alimapuensis TaxID=2820884 RepID=UPI001F3FBB4A|nr:GAP family protein [Spiractinospora alimapuensis]QVQ51547.1 GAP family protein [Spiractinospora alimapuensis]